MKSEILCMKRDLTPDAVAALLQKDSTREAPGRRQQLGLLILG